MFRMDNTDGYTQEQLDVLNEEFEQRYENGDLGTLESDEAEKAFADEVARR